MSYIFPPLTPRKSQRASQKKQKQESELAFGSLMMRSAWLLSLVAVCRAQDPADGWMAYAVGTVPDGTIRLRFLAPAPPERWSGWSQEERMQHATYTMQPQRAT